MEDSSTSVLSSCERQDANDSRRREGEVRFVDDNERFQQQDMRLLMTRRAKLLSHYDDSRFSSNSIDCEQHQRHHESSSRDAENNNPDGEEHSSDCSSVSDNSHHSHLENNSKHFHKTHDESVGHPLRPPASVGLDCTNYFTTAAAPDSRFEQYHVLVDPQQDDRAVDIPLYSAHRPHMRGFHLAWAAFFVSFFTWFAMTPLLGDISRTLHLGRTEIWTSSVLAVASSAVTRVLMGPLCDRYGARWVMMGTLLAGAVPTGLAGWLVHDETSLYLTRLFIGVARSTFVTCQYWTSSMFTVEIAGTANALAAGWGNLAGGVCQIVMGSLLFPLFKVIYDGEGYESSNHSHNDDDPYADTEHRPEELAWRTILVFPAIASIVMAWVVLRYGDDTPKGNIDSRARQNLLDRASVWVSFQQAANNRNTWVLFIHYASSFGVEITMTQAAALYFQEEFGQTTESAAAIASIFGWMNLFARGAGGFCSDMVSAKYGIRGRLWCQAILLVVEGALVVAFSHTHSLAAAIMVMVVFSVFVQAAEGSTFGIVPYVDAAVTGSVTGLVGAGGNFGGVGFALLFRAQTYRSSFMWMGLTVIACAFVTFFVSIPGHRGLLTGEDAPAVVEHRRKAKLPSVIVLQPTADAASSAGGHNSSSVMETTVADATVDVVVGE